MLLVDDRIGSRDLLSPLQKLGVPCELQHLEFGDFAFIGRGVGGADHFVGVELKRFGTTEGRSDLLRSIRSKRFAGHQLLGLNATYQEYWLLTQGIHRANEEGVLEVLIGREWVPASIGGRFVMLSDVHSWIFTQVICGGADYWHCPTLRDVAAFLSTLYNWWMRKDLDEHRSHQAIYSPPPDRAALIEPSNFVKGVVGLVHDVGWTRALALEEYCGGSVRKLAAMSVKELQRVPGIGRTIATKIVDALGTV